MKSLVSLRVERRIADWSSIEFTVATVVAVKRWAIQVELAHSFAVHLRQVVLVIAAGQ